MPKSWNVTLGGGEYKTLISHDVVSHDVVSHDVVSHDVVSHFTKPHTPRNIEHHWDMTQSWQGTQKCMDVSVDDLAKTHQICR